MKRLNEVTAGLLSALVVITFLSAAANAQDRSPGNTRNVILVHGAWADGSSWAKVIPRLEDKGLHIVAVQLPLTSLATMSPPFNVRPRCNLARYFSQDTPMAELSLQKQGMTRR